MEISTQEKILYFSSFGFCDKSFFFQAKNHKKTFKFLDYITSIEPLSYLIISCISIVQKDINIII